MTSIVAGIVVARPSAVVASESPTSTSGTPARAAMREIALARNPGALSGRTLRGMAFELRVHYRAYRMGLKRSHAAVTELGGLDSAAPDFDDNAAWFERPLRSLPAIGKALLRR